MIGTIPVEGPEVRCSASLIAVKLCPVASEVDYGSVEVVWFTTDKTLELHSLTDYILSWGDQAISHEGFVQAVHQAVRDAGVVAGFVTWTGTTAGATVSARC